jgi:glucokinase
MIDTLAIDIGGTKIDAARVDGDGRILERYRLPTEGANAEELFDGLVALVGPLLAGGALGGCGVGCGGPMTSGGEEVSPLNIPQWRSFPLRARLAERLGMPVVVDNDAKAFALAEGRLGAAAGTSDYIALVVSTGIGAGIVIDGRLLHGRLGNAGHIGHVVVESDGRPCACGGRGCLEALASGTALERVLGYPPAQAPDKVRRRTGRLVGRALGAVVNLLDLRLAVVGGSVALGFGDTFFEEAQTELDARSGLDFTDGSRVVPAGLGGDGPLVGAAEVWRHSAGPVGS